MNPPAAPFVAALPMYDFPSTASALDRIWAAMRERLRARGIAAPERLTRDRSAEATWDDPNLLFGQTCGYPLMKGLQDKVALIATPVYRFDGCVGASHCSFIVVRADDRRGALDRFSRRARGRQRLDQRHRHESFSRGRRQSRRWKKSVFRRGDRHRLASSKPGQRRPRRGRHRRRSTASATP